MKPTILIIQNRTSKEKTEIKFKSKTEAKNYLNSNKKFFNLYQNSDIYHK